MVCGKTLIERRAYKAEWRRKNIERIRAYNAEWRKKNPEKIKEYNERHWLKKAREVWKRQGGN